MFSLAPCCPAANASISLRTLACAIVNMSAKVERVSSRISPLAVTTHNPLWTREPEHRLPVVGGIHGNEADRQMFRGRNERYRVKEMLLG